MSALSRLLPDFGLPGRSASPGTPEVGPEDEAQSLASFEAGYKAGWDDAMAAAAGETGQHAEELLRNLREMSLTYHEAVAHVVDAMAPMLRQMVEAVLPELARETLSLHILSEIETLPAELASGGLTITVSPDAVSALEALGEALEGIPVKIVGSARLLDGQAEIGLAGKEVMIDLPRVLDGIGSLVDGFLFENGKALKHGT